MEGLSCNGFWERRSGPKRISGTFMALQRLARMHGHFWLGMGKTEKYNPMRGLKGLEIFVDNAKVEGGRW